jgi:hypothetical protein
MGVLTLPCWPRCASAYPSRPPCTFAHAAALSLPLLHKTLLPVKPRFERDLHRLMSASSLGQVIPPELWKNAVAPTPS